MDFFALKNPTASAGFEPANFCTGSQHATSRPPKPLNDLWFRAEIRVAHPEEGVEHTETCRRKVVNILLYKCVYVHLVGIQVCAA
jgi:hypothetical protein